MRLICHNQINAFEGILEISNRSAIHQKNSLQKKSIIYRVCCLPRWLLYRKILRTFQNQYLPNNRINSKSGIEMVTYKRPHILHLLPNSFKRTPSFETCERNIRTIFKLSEGKKQLADWLQFAESIFNYALNIQSCRTHSPRKASKLIPEWQLNLK